MLATAARLALVTAALALLATTSADAQRTHPRCVKSKDPVKCTCFRSNRGHIVNRPGGGRRAVITSMHDVDRYIACMRRNGRPNG